MSKFSRLSPLRKERSAFADPTRGPLLTPRSVLALVLFLGGIAWIAYYYVGVRPPTGMPEIPEVNEATGPAFLQDLGDWNYLIGFGLIMLGLVVSAHPSTPMGRGRGVVVGMLGCFLLGLLWICTFYVVGTSEQHADAVWVMNDLDQKNLIVGIAFMAVGFTFATRWE